MVEQSDGVEEQRKQAFDERKQNPKLMCFGSARLKPKSQLFISVSTKPKFLTYSKFWQRVGIAR